MLHQSPDRKSDRVIGSDDGRRAGRWIFLCCHRFCAVMAGGPSSISTARRRYARDKWPRGCAPISEWPGWAFRISSSFMARQSECFRQRADVRKLQGDWNRIRCWTKFRQRDGRVRGNGSRGGSMAGAGKCSSDELSSRAPTSCILGRHSRQADVRCCPSLGVASRHTWPNATESAEREYEGDRDRPLTPRLNSRQQETQ